MGRSSRAPSRARLGMLSVTILIIGGCQWQKPRPVAQEKFDPSRSTIVHVAPKEMVKIVQQSLSAPPLSLEMESVHDGTILTGWKEYEGDIHIVRRWRERTRFKIAVLPDFSDPLNTSHVDVFDETEEKPSDPQPWYPNPDLRRPERSDQVLKAIVEAANKK